MIDITNLLKVKGYRITKSRREVASALQQYPLTIQEIFLRTQKKAIECNLSSVYRAIQLFFKLGVIKEIDFGDGKKRYEYTQLGKHHHHVVCNNCCEVTDVSLEEEREIIEKIS